MSDCVEGGVRAALASENNCWAWWRPVGEEFNQAKEVGQGGEDASCDNSEVHAPRADPETRLRRRAKRADDRKGGTLIDQNWVACGLERVAKGVVPVIARIWRSPIIAADGTIYLIDVGYVYAIAGFAPPSPGPWPMKRHDAQGTGRVSSVASAE